MTAHHTCATQISVSKYSNFLLGILLNYTYWILADAQVKKDLNIRPISPEGFFTFLIAVAHGGPCPPPILTDQ